MNGELWVPGKPNSTKPYCNKRGCATTDPIFPSYSWDSDGVTEQTTKPTKCNQTAAVLEIVLYWQIRRYLIGKQTSLLPYSVISVHFLIS
jgi:hypothetical protein